MGERQMLPVHTKQILKSADSSKVRSKLMDSFSRSFEVGTARHQAVEGESRPSVTANPLPHRLFRRRIGHRDPLVATRSRRSGQHRLVEGSAVFDSVEVARADPVARARLAHALQRQLAALESAAHAVGAARRSLPAARSSGFWRGEANARYGDAVDDVSARLETAEKLLGAAVSQSRRAIASLADRGW
jgi:uncharacterized protein YukE